jgi:formylglycine-generating enzyme required for sulfatase activity
LFATALVISAPAFAEPAAPATKSKVLVLDPTGTKVNAEDRKSFTGLIAASLTRWPMFDVVTTADVQKAMELQAQQQLLGCMSEACLGDVATLTAANLVVFGDVNRLGSLLVFNLSLYDAGAAKSVGRVSIEAKSLDALPSLLRLKMDGLVADAIRAFRAAGSDDGKTCPASMVRIPAGQFFMGADDDDTDPLLKNAHPSHNVTLAAFCIDKYEVTVDDYASCSSAGKCKRASRTVDWPGITDDKRKLYSQVCTAGKRDRGKHPINCVNWKAAARYCEAQGARLPTEAEWEFATRGPDGRRFPWGDDPPTAADLNACGGECAAWAKANGGKAKTLYEAEDGYANTAPVGSFPAGASRFGPHDVVGNVWEWVNDRYGPYAGADLVDPRGPAKGKKRVVRGGAFNGGFESWLRPAFRFSAPESQRSHAIGFRCARSLD